MSTFLFVTQFICYGVGIVSASLNIANVVRHWRITSSACDELPD